MLCLVNKSSTLLYESSFLPEQKSRCIDTLT